jgi:hypothetical protein
VRSVLLSVLLSLLVSSLTHAQDARPPILWIVEPPDWIHIVQHIIPSQSGGFIAGTVPSTDHKPIVCFDDDGNVLWEAGDCGIGFAYWVEELDDGSIVATGYGSDPAETTYGFWITKVSDTGEPIWGKVYEVSGSIAEKGLCITELPDGGFAVCGQVPDHSAWTLRTDSLGDTLWARTWQSGWSRAERVVYQSNGITVYVYGSGGHPWLLRYSMDGDLLWQQDYSFDPSPDYGGSMCIAPDGGYALATAYYSSLVHTDWSGQEEWREEITGASGRLGLSLDPTMDGGYIFSGWGGYWGSPDASAELHSAPADTGQYRDGWLVKMDSLGQSQWVFYNCLGNRQNYFNCARQLPQGGYIVGGQIWDLENSDWNGYLIRLAPETGIEEWEPSPFSTLSASPSPFSSAVEISFSLAVPSEVQLSVYDLAGRRIDDLWVGSSPAGEHALTWAPGPSIPVGCYLVVLHTPGERQVRRVVRL